jgi:hypothetical protein
VGHGRRQTIAYAFVLEAAAVVTVFLPVVAIVVFLAVSVLLLVEPLWSA